MKVAQTIGDRFLNEEGKEVFPTRFVECDKSYEYEIMGKNNVAKRFLNEREPYNFNANAEARANVAGMQFVGIPAMASFDANNPYATPSFTEVPDYLLQGDGWGFSKSNLTSNFDAILTP